MQNNTLTKRLIADMNKCTGCMSCTQACAFKKMQVFGLEYARVQVLKLEESGVDCPIFCQQCEEARCMEACPKDAIVRDRHTGIIVIDESICDGCTNCLIACPYGAITVHPESPRKRRVMLKCDLCEGDPECLKWCEPGAIQYVDMEEADLIKEARENLVLFKKRYEIEHHRPLYKYYTKVGLASGEAE